MALHGARATTFKVVILGEGRVGKTSLCLRYMTGEFDQQQPSTIAAAFSQRTLDTPSGPVILNVSDTAGQERFHSLAPLYYRGAKGALLVYDITDASTLHRVRRWIAELRKMADKDISLVICGNKADLEAQREVSRDDAEKLAAENGAEHVQCSAKSAQGVEIAFFKLTLAMLKQNKITRRRGGAHNSYSHCSLVAPEPDTQAKTWSCCG